MLTGRHRFRQPPVVLAILLLGLVLLTGWINPRFFSPENIFDLLKGSAPLGLFALGMMVVLISGGIDLSFPAIAAGSLYLTTLAVTAARGLDHLPVVFAVAGLIGATLGSLNGALIHFFELPALIATLGTGSLIRGGLLAFVGTRMLTDIPESMVRFSQATILNIGSRNSGLPVGLAWSFVIFIGMAGVVAFLLNHTTLGRQIYAIGGNLESARRLGLPVGRVRWFVYGFSGFLAGTAGVIHASQMRLADPFSLSGVELTVIAAVILGGASISGGRGTVVGTVLGILILVLMENSLVLVGLPSTWHKVALGAVILASVGLASWRLARGKGELSA